MNLAVKRRSQGQLLATQPDTAGRQITGGTEGEEGRLARLMRKVLVFVWLRRPLDRTWIPSLPRDPGSSVERSRT